MVAETKAVCGECEHIAERASELWQRAAKMTEDVGAMRAAVTDAIDEGKEVAAKSVEEVRRRARDLKDMPDKLAHRVSDHPFGAIGMAIGAGLVAGALVGWFAARTTHHA